jgi:FkbM family methyltransferase
VLIELFRNNSLGRRFKHYFNLILNFNRNPFKTIYLNIHSIENPILFDVGANVGQFAIDMRNNGFSGKIYSYEPVSNTYMKLLKKAKKFKSWYAINCALGSVNGFGQINVSANAGLSSSFLGMGTLHSQSFPNSMYVTQEKVEVRTLDCEISRLQLDAKQIILKIDVQGFESKVLEGGSASIPKIPFCFIEISLVSLYEDEKIFLSLLHQLESLGHQVIDIFPGTRDSNGKLLQVDVLTSNSV